MTESQFFDKAACAAPHAAAAETGRAILAEGGNALEAMIGMAATIAVVYPHMNAIGGDGFWVIQEPGGRVRYIEAAGPAGARATRERYRALGHDTIPPRGPLSAVTIPGTVGGWALAQDLARQLGGRLPLADILGDAARHARDGVPVSPSEARTTPFENESLKLAPGYAATYLVDGKASAAGMVRKFPALAATLAHLGIAGLDDFYRGDVGRELAADMDAIEAGGTRADLEAYHAVWREPLMLPLAGRKHYNAQPPTQGLASLVLLGLFDRLDVKAPESFAHIHGLIEASKRALAIRDRVCTDFDRLLYNPRDFLTPEALRREADMIDMKRAATIPVKSAPGDTVWMGAIDASGLAVSFIQSIYWEFGSGCVLPRTGVLLQNRGISFSLDPKAVNPLTPGRRPTHTLNPALAAFDDGRVAVYGAMGGDGQPQFQAQLFTRLMFGDSVATAIDRPRYLFGKTWGTALTSLRCEPRFDEGLIAALRRAGHEVEVADEPYADTFGHAGALIRRKDGRIEAGHDPRSDGGAAGV
jgi:gamma-glutamyltranspeptidase/glutathione hydrolase